MESTSELREQIIKSITDFMDCWPDLVAMWEGMVKQLTDNGWSDHSARALVLSSVTSDNAAILATFHEESDDETDLG